ncbi:MAG TPA: hypothetical protein VGG85_04830 [Terracidiphilus sp.]
MFTTGLVGAQVAPMRVVVPETKEDMQTKPVSLPTTIIAAPVEAPLPPPRPKLPVDLPAKAAKVTCSGNQLTISAENSTLESILVQVRGCSGAHIEIPDGAAKVRTYEQLGPGPMRSVLDALLSGTEFNYVLESSDTDPAKLQNVLLTVRAKDGPAGPGGPAGSAGPDGRPSDLAMTPARRAWTHMQKFDKPDPQASEENAAAAPETPAASASPAATPTDATDANSTQAAAAPDNTPIAAPIADPAKVEDRISSMQQMFDQRRQMIEKQGPPAGQSTPAPNN